MPIYEYECTQCGQVEEVIQKFTDNPLTTCNKCSGSLHKLISHSSFHLKGTGWYVTDYAAGSNKNAASPKPAEGTSPPPKPEASASTASKSES
jgi:putative FmdB family regulatory protein